MKAEKTGLSNLGWWKFIINEGFGGGFEFVFQITSDEQINLNVIDSGSLMFAKNEETKDWSLYYDFY